MGQRKTPQLAKDPQKQFNDRLDGITLKITDLWALYGANSFFIIEKDGVLKGYWTQKWNPSMEAVPSPKGPKHFMNQDEFSRITALQQLMPYPDPNLDPALHNIEQYPPTPPVGGDVSQEYIDALMRVQNQTPMSAPESVSHLSSGEQQIWNSGNETADPPRTILPDSVKSTSSPRATKGSASGKIVRRRLRKRN